MPNSIPFLVSASLAALALLGPAPASGATAETQPIPPRKIAAPPIAKPAKAVATKIVWDHWYVAKQGAKPYFVLNEKVESRGDRAFVQTRKWIAETEAEGGKAGAIAEENLGTLATADLTMRPLFFNFRRHDSGGDLVVSANLETAGKAAASIQVRTPDGKSHAIPFPAAKDAILSQTFPVWIGARMKTLAVGKSYGFSVIVESDVPGRFAPISAVIKRVAELRFELAIPGEKQVWQVDARGAAVRVESVNSGIVMERAASEAAARATLGV